MDLAALANKRLAWRATLSADEQAALEADRAAFSNEETKAERMAEMAATFQAADTNQDGRLDRSEFEDFMGKLAQNSAARNVPFQPQDQFSDEEKDGVYALFDAKEGTPGVTMPDFIAVVGDI